MRKWICLAALLLTFFTSLAYAAEKALILNLNGPVSPAAQDYIQRGIAQAEENKDDAVIIQLDTPGGLETSMRGINAAIIASTVPVIAYVYPSGSRAASAGLFIVYASHIAAMAPGTNIGAASPVSLTSSSETTKALSNQEKKAVNDASAYIRSLAQLRNRNVTWAEQAVRDASSITAEEAKNIKAIDIVAANYPQLLQQLDGRTVTINGMAHTLQTKNMQLQQVETDWRYKFLAFITNPNIAYILMLIAIYGIFFEFANPGMVLPGVVGIIALLLVLYAFQLLPINYAGLALILIGLGFMIFEIYASSFGVIGVGGIIAFIIGSVLLFDVRDAHYQLSWTLILTMCLITFSFFLIILTLVFRSHKKQIVSGPEALIGSEGVVVSVMNEQTIVRVMGELWEARAPQILNAGDPIKVVRVQGLKLDIVPLEKKRRSNKGE